MKPIRHNKKLSWAKITLNPVAPWPLGPLRSLWLVRPLEASRQPPAMSTWNFGSETQHAGKCWFFLVNCFLVTMNNTVYSTKYGVSYSTPIQFPSCQCRCDVYGEMAIRHDLTKENSPKFWFHGDLTNKPTMIYGDLPGTCGDIGWDICCIKTTISMGLGQQRMSMSWDVTWFYQAGDIKGFDLTNKKNWPTMLWERSGK